MDKKSKEALMRRYKKSRQQAQSSSDSSSSSDSDSGSSDTSYSSSDSEQKATERHRKKKGRQTAAGSSRRSSSSSAEERRKREKREHCQKKLEAKRNHLKRKLKEAKLKKRAAQAAAVLSGHTSHRSLSPGTQAKLKKLTERKHQRALEKERREREREKHRAALRDSEREHHRGDDNRSPSKITKIRIHQDVKRQKTPQRMHHQLMSREKIIIQTRTRDRTPSTERGDRVRHEHKLRHDEIARERERRERDRERAEREADRERERAEALARCQERQRERERIAREKLRREEEDKKYGNDRSERMLPRSGDMTLGRGYNSRERSMETIERTRHTTKRELDPYEREREYLEAERRNLLDRDDIRRERDYMGVRRRELSPLSEHYSSRIRDPRDLYSEEERDRTYNRGYLDDGRLPRDRDAWLDSRDMREMHDFNDTRDFREMDRDILYSDDRDRLIHDRERTLAGRGDWKNDWDMTRERDWDDVTATGRSSGFVGNSKRISSSTNTPQTKMPSREQRSAPTEADWDANEIKDTNTTNTNKTDAIKLREGPSFSGNMGQRENWIEHDQRDLQTHREKTMLTTGRSEHTERHWQPDWREVDDCRIGNTSGPIHHHRGERGGRNYRRGGVLEHGERNPQNGGFRPHPPPLMTIPIQPPGGFHGQAQRFSAKRMTYTNPILIKKQQVALAAAKATAVAAAKAAAQSAANATTNPGILGQVRQLQQQQQGYVISDEKPEAGEIVAEIDGVTGVVASDIADTTMTAPPESMQNDDKVSGELSEISDSDDDILNKAEKKIKLDGDEDVQASVLKPQASNEPDDDVGVKEDEINSIDKADDDEMLDFEEISDGELEDDGRNKGVGDALGVDWASLIAETKCHVEQAVPNLNDESTTAKQKWQPHRIILDIGISMRMAGKEYAQCLLTSAKQILDSELGQIRTKTDIKEEVLSTADEDSQTQTIDTDDNTSDVLDETKFKEKLTHKTLDELNEATVNIEHLHPVACIQVADRKRNLKHRKLISVACGLNSRALSARQDLKLRRQLCSLPATECNFPRPIPAVCDKLKTLALLAFQNTLEVK